MKVLLVNSSPHEKGSTYTALSTVADILEAEGIGTEIFWLGMKPVSGCMSCRRCAETGRCAISDKVNEFLDLAETADGFVFGSPVHYAAACGTATSFMDRAFFAGTKKNSPFYLKPAAAVAAARRAGTTSALDQMNKYFVISGMPVVPSSYWPMVFGTGEKKVLEDLEGLQIMRDLGRNMAFLLKCKAAGLQAGVPLPAREDKIFTNFVR